MKLNHAPQAGLRRSPPDRRRETMAFWGGILILALFEVRLPENPNIVVPDE